MDPGQDWPYNIIFYDHHRLAEVMASPTYMTLNSFGFTKADMKLLIVQALRGISDSCLGTPRHWRNRDQMTVKKLDGPAHPFEQVTGSDVERTVNFH